VPSPPGGSNRDGNNGYGDDIIKGFHVSHSSFQVSGYFIWFIDDCQAVVKAFKTENKQMTSYVIISISGQF
jgi:hypothetical protein